MADPEAVRAGLTPRGRVPRMFLVCSSWPFGKQTLNRGIPANEHSQGKLTSNRLACNLPARSRDHGSALIGDQHELSQPSAWVLLAWMISGVY